jgi:tetratricopeptide (TPR) repeat protein
LVATAVVLLVGAWMIGNRTGPVLAQSHWHRYRIMARAALDREPYDTQQGDPAAVEASGRASRHALETMISELEQVVRHGPDRADARFELAKAYLLLFEYTQEESVNVMPLPMIREAAIHAHFPSREALDAWLARSVGEHCKYLDLALRHTRRGLALCPLEGVGYLYLAELCFLEGRDPATAKPAYVAQALKVRPFDGTILMAAGNEAVLAGDIEQAVDYWRRSYRCGRIHQRQLLARLAGRARPEHLQDEIAFFLNTFEPDLTMLRRMDQIYGRIAQSEQLVELRRRHAEAAAAEAKRLKGESAGVVWLEARLQYVKLGDHARAVQCLRNALARDPNSYKVRYRLAIGLADQRQYAEAEKHLQWCLARRPGDPQLQGKLREIMRRRLERPVLTATGEQSGELR